VSDIATVSRALNSVRTAGQAKVAIGEALSELGRSYRSEPRITPENARTLDRVRLPLEAWYAEIASLPAATDYRAAFAARKDQIVRAYVETYGILGEIQAKQSVSFLSELGTGFKELPRDIGKAVGAVATGVGETAGSLVGGLFTGLGPVVVIILAVVLYVVWKSRR
jgi:hypothetical protein